MNILRLLVAVLLLGVSSLAAADPQSYTNIELSLGRQGSVFLDGGTSFRIAGSYDLSDTYFIFGQYGSNTFGDFSSSQSGLDAKESLYNVGLGVHFAVADATDWVTRFALQHDRATSDVLVNASAHTGYDLGTGFNIAVATGLELSTFLDHTTASTDATDSLFNTSSITAEASQTILSAAVHAQISRNMDFGVTEEFNTLGQSRFLLSLRWDF